jgi:hypothetical protein
MSKFLQYVFFIFLIGPLSWIGTDLHAQVVDTVEMVQPPVEDSTTVVDEEYYEDEEEEELAADTLLMQSYWKYPMDSIQRLKRETDFDYALKLDSLLKKRQELQLKKQRERERKMKKQKPSVFAGDSFFLLIRIVLWTLLIGALLFVLYRVFLSDRGLFTSPTRNKQLDVEEEALTDEGYLEQQLNEAIRNGNYRLAIRFLYLQSLSRVAAKGWLQLSPDKTNYQYVREFAKPQLKKEFSRVTLHYEYAWYGDFVIASNVFESVKQEFDQFHKNIQQN